LLLLLFPRLVKVLIVVLKLPLGARDDVKEGRRPLDLKRAFGDRGGLRTPLVPFWPERVPDVERRDVDIVIGRGECCFAGVGVCEIIEVCDEILDWIENCGGGVVVEALNGSECSATDFGLGVGVTGATGAAEGSWDGKLVGVLGATRA
jgi:hypothetical protein